MTLRTKRERAQAANHYALLAGKPAPYAVPGKRTRKPTEGPTEHQIQAAVIYQWKLMHHRYGLPEYALYAVPNGGRRDAITGARLKAEGVRSGILDLNLDVARGLYHGLRIELKRPGAINNTSDAQDEVIVYLRKAGYLVAVCDDPEKCINIIKAYLSQ